MDKSAPRGEMHQLIVFKIGKEEFGVPIQQVKEIIRLTPITAVPRSPVFIEGVINLRGQIVAVVDLARRLQLKPQPRCDNTRIIVLEIETNTVGVIVDEVSEVLRFSSDAIEKAPELIVTELQQKYIKGVGKLGERLIILVDLVKIFTQKEVEDLRAHSAEHNADQA